MAITSVLSSAPIRTSARTGERSGFIVGPLFDSICFIGAPLLALGLGLLLADSPLDRDSAFFDYDKSWVDFGLGVFIFAHLIIVIFRSHLNPKIFRLHPWRFTLIPLGLFLAMGLSTWVLVCCSVLATFWDVYHSGLQTFGLSRIYDSRAGNPADKGRRLDYLLNLLLYAGPIAAGATLMDHVEDFEEFEAVGAAFFTQIPAYADSNAQYLTWAVIAVALPFLAYYLYAYWRLSKAGYRVSKQKIWLLVSTAVCSVYAWGFNPFGMAFFIMNFFHALQYFAIVWWSEKGNVARCFGFDGRRSAKLLSLAVIIAVGLGYGVFVESVEPQNDWLFALFLLVSLMHFWYDGFVWSVGRGQV
ncbi:MAG: hypothetical protein MI920_23980 [Kiloniellales bacterium]|nr:hypothetical protein [Kiloniellales bacterium]